MKVIMRSRGAGKTAEAIKMSIDKEYNILVRTVQQKKVVKDLAKSLGYKKEQLPKVFCLSELDDLKRTKTTGVVVDNADDILVELLGLDIKGLTVIGDKSEQQILEEKEMIERLLERYD